MDTQLPEQQETQISFLASAREFAARGLLALGLSVGALAATEVTSTPDATYADYECPYAPVPDYIKQINYDDGSAMFVGMCYGDKPTDTTKPPVDTTPKPPATPKPPKPAVTTPIATQPLATAPPETTSPETIPPTTAEPATTSTTPETTTTIRTTTSEVAPTTTQAVLAVTTPESGRSNNNVLLGVGAAMTAVSGLFLLAARRRRVNKKQATA
ncbi:MAG: hypothetical protein WCJ60_04810 [bacterium]